MRVMLVTGFYPGERMGGAEYQASLMAGGLADRGHQVVFLAAAAGSRGARVEGGVTVREVPGWPVTGWEEHRRLVGEVIEEARPEVVYVRMLTELANASSLCREAGIPVVSASSSLREVSPLLFGYYPVETIAHLRAGRTVPHLRSFRAIGSSAAHVCNTQELQRRLQRWFPRMKVRVIYNGSPPPKEDEWHGNTTGQVVWVNNIKRRKRPQLFVELARHLPEYRFAMAGAMPSEGRYGRQVKAMFRDGPPNLDYVGPLPLEAVNRLIAQSDLLVYTSKPGSEGFGNSYLQAWFRGVPTVSLSFGLDGILEQEGVGRCSPTFRQMVTDVQALMHDEPARLQMGLRGREYALRNHHLDRMVDDYEALFQEVVGRIGADRCG